jgi:hypothetical protein
MNELSKKIIEMSPDEIVKIYTDTDFELFETLTPEAKHRLINLL